MPQVSSKLTMEWKQDFSTPYWAIKVIGGMYVPHNDHQKSKKEGRAFTIQRAVIKTRWTWLNPGPGKLGADFNLDYIDARGRTHRVDNVDFFNTSEPIYRENDITEAFSPANFGVNIVIVTGATHGDFPWNVNNFKAEHTILVTYGVS